MGGGDAENGEAKTPIYDLQPPPRSVLLSLGIHELL